MNYITRTINGITLYFDGEKFTEHAGQAKRYEIDEAMQEIADKEIQFADITPISDEWMRVNDFAFKLINP